MRISDWSSDVCSSDLIDREKPQGSEEFQLRGEAKARQGRLRIYKINIGNAQAPSSDQIPARNTPIHQRSEEHTTELQSLMLISYAVFFLTYLISMQISISSLQTPTVIRCNRSRHYEIKHILMRSRKIANVFE